MRNLLRSSATTTPVLPPAPKQMPEHLDFGSTRYGLGEDPKHIRLEAIEAIESVDTFQVDVYLRNGRTVPVTWMSVDDMLEAIGALSNRRFVGFAMPEQTESYLAIAADALDDSTKSPEGCAAHLASGRSVTIHGLDPQAVRRRLKTLNEPKPSL